MEIFQDRRLWLTVGGGLVVAAAAVVIALGIMARDQRSQTPPPASTGGLVVQAGRAGDAKLDPRQTLRCFVAGQFEGMETLADCASKNGVAAKALDVGTDQTGALAAAGEAGTVLTPLPPSAAQSPGGAAQEVPQGAAVAVQGQAVGECLRYGGSSGWRRVGDGLSLSACAQALFNGRCERLGGASYGRWANQTLRLVPHRVEISSDDKTFRTVVEQTDAGCIVPEF